VPAALDLREAANCKCANEKRHGCVCGGMEHRVAVYRTAILLRKRGVGGSKTR
jgi:hypothetical protein